MNDKFSFFNFENSHQQNMEYDLSLASLKMKLQNENYKKEFTLQVMDNISLKNFVALDFETANSSRSSACALGLVEYSNSKIIASKYWIFKPQPFRFDYRNIQVTGLNPNDFEDAPSLNDVWEEIKPFISNKLIVSHNASFDIDVLKKSLMENNIDIPNFTYLCTYLMSKSLYKNLDNYRLDTIANFLQLPTFRHHNALEDAKVCGAIANIIFKDKTANELTTVLNIQLGVNSEFLCTNCKLLNTTGSTNNKINGEANYIKYKYQKASETVIENYHNLFYNNSFLRNKHIAITGDFHNFNRNELLSLLELSNVSVHSSVTKTVSILLLGEIDDNTSKYKKALDLIAKGQKIDIISEKQLLDLLNSNKIKEGDESYAKL